LLVEVAVVEIHSVLMLVLVVVVRVDCVQP
jgi:hypothetical protein